MHALLPTPRSVEAIHSIRSTMSTIKHLQTKPRPDLLIVTLPLPLLSTHTLNAPIHSSQFQREPWSDFLQSRSDVLGAFHLFAIDALNRLFGLSLVSEDVSMASDEDVVTLVV